MSVEVYFTPWSAPDADGDRDREVCFRYEESDAGSMDARSGRITVYGDGSIDVTMYGDERDSERGFTPTGAAAEDLVAAEAWAATVAKKRGGASFREAKRWHAKAGLR